MKTKIQVLLILIGMMSASALSAEKDWDISGQVKLFASLYGQDNSQGNFFLHQAGEFGFKRLETRLKFAGRINQKVSFGLRFDAYGFPGEMVTASGFPETGPLNSPWSSEYFELNLYEAFIKVNGFVFKNLDLTVGKQRIAWGTADKLNVVDNLNPIDFANFFTFDPDFFAERRPQAGLNLEYWLGKTRIQLVWLLQHQLSPMPYGFSALARNFFQLESVEVERSWDNTLADSNLGLRVSSQLAGVDFAFSYYRGNSALPVLDGLVAGPQMKGHFYYPWLQVAGFDGAGEFKGVGFWAEVALNFPEQVEGWLKVPVIINGASVEVENRFPLFRSSYLKFVGGLDYNFGRGFYVNLQYLHGFFDEFGYSPRAVEQFPLAKGMFFGRLSDYLIGRLEWKSRNENLKLKLGAMNEFAGPGSSFTLLPELEWRVADALLIQTGLFAVLSGDAEQTKFGQFKKDKLFYISLKTNF